MLEKTFEPQAAEPRLYAQWEESGLFAPRANLAEFFGLWTFSTRLASIVGPLAYGVITWVTGGNQRVAIAATALLFVLGLLALMPINVQRGRAAALQPV